MPFEKSEAHIYDYARNDLAMRWVVDATATSNSNVFVLRKHGECCGSEGNYFQFVAVSNGIKDADSFKIETPKN